MHFTVEGEERPSDAEMPRSSSSAGGEGAADDVDAFEEEGGEERCDILLDDLMSISGKRAVTRIFSTLFVELASCELFE